MVLRKAIEVPPDDFWFAQTSHWGPAKPITELSRHIIVYGYCDVFVPGGGAWIQVPTEELALTAAKLLMAIPCMANIGCDVCGGGNMSGCYMRWSHLIPGPFACLSKFDPWPWLHYPQTEWVGRV